ncbi:MAG: hypothetical protein IMY72_07755 [Bacteroidetes bacterium]|nr:hypothetical protein [Bacteroidota bacterium]
MENNEKKFNPEESLKLIDDMITTAKGNIKDGSFYFLLWAWIVIAGSLGHYILLKFTTFEHPYIAWSVIFVGIILSMVHGFMQSKRDKVTSHIEKVYVFIWFAFLISYFIIGFFSSKINYQITPIVFILSANATFLSGIIIKFKPLIFGGIFMWVAAIITFFLSPENQLLSIPIIVTFGYLIPGYILRCKEKKDV